MVRSNDMVIHTQSLLTFDLDTKHAHLILNYLELEACEVCN